MDWFLAAAFNHDVQEISAGYQTPFGFGVAGVEVATLFEPELGIQSRVFYGNDDRLYCRISLGGVLFTDPVPTAGTESNFILGYKLAYKLTPVCHSFVEFRHYSNGRSMLGHTDRNPGLDRLLIGLTYNF